MDATKTATKRKLSREALEKSLDPENLKKADIEAFRDRYSKDPALFCSEILNFELDENQKKMAESVKNNKKCCFISARGVGKSCAMSALAIWFFSVFPRSKTILGANTAYQTRVVLWSKVSELINQSAIASWFEITENFIYYKGCKDLGFLTRITCSSDKVESISGFHAKNMIYFIDESSAVDDRILTNLLASCTEENNRMVLCSNPTRANGFTADAARSEGWKTLNVSGFDSKWTNKDFLREMVEKYGEDSDICRVQVFGKFPKQSANILISNEQIEECVKATGHTGDVVLGIDIAASGTDLSVWCVRRGGEVLTFEDESSSTVDSLVEHTIRIVDQFKVERIFVDSTGMGWTCPDILKKNIPAVEINGVNFSSKTPQMPQYFNERARMYGEMANHMKNGEISLHNVRDKIGVLKEELGATQQFLNNSGQFQLSPKENIRNLIGRSPDLTDALALTFATEIPFTFTHTRGEKRKVDDSLFLAGLWG